MKYILKAVTGIIFLPFIILGGIIAVVKTLFKLTFGLAWKIGDDGFIYLLGKVDNFMVWIKNDK